MLTKRQTNGVYLRIVDGSIVRTSDVEKEGYDLFVTKNPTTNQEVRYWIERFERVTGTLVGFSRVDKPDKHIHGWQMTLRDDTDYHLSLSDNRSTTTRVLKMLRCVDLTKPLEVGVWKDGEGKTAIVFKQDGQNVPQNFDKTNLPPPKQRPNGKYDFSESEDILYQDAMEFSRELGTPSVLTPQFSGEPPVDTLNAPEKHPDGCECPTCLSIPF